MSERDTVPLPLGYRWLMVGERIRKDDLFYDSTVKRAWAPVSLCVATMNNPDGLFARKLDEPTPEREWVNPWD